jgi:hypothetical protein
MFDSSYGGFRFAMARYAGRQKERWVGCRKWLGACFLMAAVTFTLGLGCSGETEGPAIENDPQADLVLEALIESEDLVLDLTPRLTKLARWFESPETSNRPLHASLQSVRTTTGLQPIDVEQIFLQEPTMPTMITVAHWPIGEEAEGPSHPWAPLSQLAASWETIKFGVIKASFADDAKTMLIMDTKVEGRGHGSSGAAFGLKGHQHLYWRKTGSEWELTRWVQDNLTILRTSQPMFRETLSELVSNQLAYRRATRSYKDEIMVEASKTGQLRMPAPQHERWTNATSNHIFPSVSVVDYDGDGWDDLFLTARWGPTQLLRNEQGRSFTDVTVDAGLYFEFMVNCAVFADLDNDGDKDVIIGRPMERAL